MRTPPPLCGPPRLAAHLSAPAPHHRHALTSHDRLSHLPRRPTADPRRLSSATGAVPGLAAMLSSIASAPASRLGSFTSSAPFGLSAGPARVLPAAGGLSASGESPGPRPGAEGGLHSVAGAGQAAGTTAGAGGPAHWRLEPHGSCDLAKLQAHWQDEAEPHGHAAPHAPPPPTPPPPRAHAQHAAAGGGGGLLPPHAHVITTAGPRALLGASRAPPHAARVGLASSSPHAHGPAGHPPHPSAITPTTGATGLHASPGDAPPGLRRTSQHAFPPQPHLGHSPTQPRDGAEAPPLPFLARLASSGSAGGTRCAATG